ncbi:hypothetical protein [Shewanella sp. OMA3-2]|uniref:hypothetical protein n=1 Tax=Shewanella sp. OMA3-2 TaxID=2908650 RepID=UPI001F1DE19C|nr:hypothetical protein [Shewanella sp. OMA3-2]UJF22459.1 hypothetical protein L0B17_03295 [Shewanella sp. OMA3-2]
MSLDSIYAMLSKPAQFITQRKRIVNSVSVSSEITPDSHDDPQAELPSSNTDHVHHTQTKQKSKLEYVLGTGDYITDDDAPVIEHKSKDKNKHIDLEV